MQVFGFDPAEYSERFAEQGWVHVPNGVDSEFLDEVRGFVAREFESHRTSGRGIGGKMEQAVYEFPVGVNFPDELFDVVAGVAGLRRESMTLSERHIKVYDPDVPADPPAHKDRLSSQVSVGLSIEIPEGSQLVLYPYEHREVNPFNFSAALRESLPEEELPENLLRDAREVVIEDQPGDVMLFHGSSMWHKRRNGAGAVNLYLKFNDFGSDPLGEDPNTARLREATVAALGDGAVGGLVPVRARRLDAVIHQDTRQPGLELIQADVWGSKPVRLSEEEVRILELADGQRTIEDLAGSASTDGSREGIETSIRRLAERGVIDLLRA